MNLLQYAGRLYSLDTLDTRFTTSSKTPPSRIDPARPSPDEALYRKKSKSEADDIVKGASQPRWTSPEFLYHGLVVFVAVPLMFKTAYDVSKRKGAYAFPRALQTDVRIASHQNYDNFAPLLSPGWIPGRKVDNSDQQYATFRDNVPYLLIVMTLHPLLRRIYDSFYNIASSSSSESLSNCNGNDSPTGSASQSLAADGRLNQRISFDVGFSVVFLLALHGFSALKVLLILYINYTLATRLRKDYVPVATWVFNIGILFANELGKGYPYSDMANVILPWSAPPETLTEKDPKGNWGTVLDSYGGLIPRWEILFNVTVLRLISFNMDYMWSLNRGTGSPVEVREFQVQQ